jgi:NAD(P)-dependent dehydrogenase (short-subunit alcohol dehydrogenase family)
LSAEEVGPLGSSGPIGPGDLVVITGGARGVTAEVAVALAGSFRPTLVLLGRSPAPEAEPDWLAPLTGESEIKRALASRANGKATPQLVGEQFRGVAANREILRTLGRIEAAGSKAVYRQVDVRDSSAVSAAVSAARDEFGPVRGFVHGAGVLADRKIEDQTDAQFAEVYSTKVAGLRGLLGAVGSDDLKLLVLFSSSTARFGRLGQVAYAAANEVLNKHAQAEALRRPGCRVVSVNWGPWDGGMVTPSLRPVFASEGVGLIPLADGARFLVDEIRSTASGAPVEVVVLGAGSIDPAPPAAKPAVKAAGLTTVFERPLDPDALPILRSHVIDGRAVLPMALTLEWLAQGAIQRNPGLTFCGLDDLRLFKGVVATDDEPETIAVLVGKGTKEPGGLFRATAELRGIFPGGRTVTHARCDVILGDQPPQPPSRSIDPTGQAAFGKTTRAVYHDLLFHGPDLHGLERIDVCTAEVISAWAKTAPSPSAWIDRPLRQAWLTDPLVLDSAFQLMVLWSSEHAGAPSLPTAVGRYRQFCRAFPGPKVQVVASVHRPSPLHAVAAIEFLDPAGALLARLDGYECVGNPSLVQAFRRNRLPRVVRSPG